MIVITADEVERVLTRWQRRELTAGDVHAWAEARYAVDAYEPESDAVNEVLGELDQLNISLIVEADIPALLQALRSAAFASVLKEHFQSVDFKERQVELRRFEFYSRFCG